MERYKVSNSFINLGFKHEPSDHGTVEKYTYEEIQNIIPVGKTRRVEALIRVWILMDINTGMPITVSINLGVDNQWVDFFNENIDINHLSGEECEEAAIQIIRDELGTYNRVLNAHFCI